MNEVIWRFIRGLGWMMIVAGLLVFAFLAYQLFGTNFITNRTQAEAETQLAERFAALEEDIVIEEVLPPLPPEADPAVAPSERVPVLWYQEPVPAEGEPLGKITIPKLETEHFILEGVTRSILKGGPGHMPWTPMPGQPGNAVVSGHRTTYGAPFGDLDQLILGDAIVVDTGIGSHEYQVRDILIVGPSDVWVTEDRAGSWLTLTTCHPRFSARERLVIVAELVDGPNLEYAASLSQGSLGSAS